LVGIPCDEDGDDIPPDLPPPPRETSREPDDWTPYESWAQFKTAYFLFKRNQMSAPDIDFLSNLWRATLAPHGNNPPFTSHTDLYSTIDMTTLGDVAWDTFSLKYNSVLPEGQTLPWMLSEYDIWFRDPRSLIHNIISNPDFDNEFDYSPIREFDAEGSQRYQNLMSGNWA